MLLSGLEVRLHLGEGSQVGTGEQSCPGLLLGCQEGLLILGGDLALPVLSMCMTGDACKRAELRVSTDGRLTRRSLPTRAHLSGSQAGSGRRKPGSGAANYTERSQDGGLGGQVHRQLGGEQARSPVRPGGPGDASMVLVGLLQTHGSSRRQPARLLPSVKGLLRCSCSN